MIQQTSSVKRRVNLIDCSLRDGHQSLLATRVSTEQVMIGKSGKLPGPADPEVVQLVAKGQQPFTGRAADLVEDIDLEKVYAEHGKLIQSHRDLLLLLFPTPAKQFLTARQRAAV